MLKTYIGTKCIQAEPQDRTMVQCLADETKKLVVPEDVGIISTWLKSQNLDPTEFKTIYGVPGYKVVYPDGYTSWSPKDAFESAYRAIGDGLPFEMALICMKAGACVARKGWVDATMRHNLHADSIPMVSMRSGYKGITLNDSTCDAFKIPYHTTGDVAPYLQMRQGDKFQVYIPSMNDLMADDWCVFRPDPNKTEFFTVISKEEGPSDE